MMMNQRILRILVLGFACVACTSNERSLSIDEVLEGGVAGGRIPGVVAMAATSEGIIYQGTAGDKDIASNQTFTLDTIARIASMTKAITSVAVMQLVEQDKIGLDQPISEYLSQFSKVEILDGFNEDNSPILKPARSAPTIRQLLTHTSGYVYDIWNEEAALYTASGYAEKNGKGPLEAPLAFSPGTNWEYGISTDILGVLVETISGQRLNEYFHEHIFVPLKMSDTYFIVPDEKLARIATLYSKPKQGELAAIPYSPPSNAFFSGGGGLYSTAGDYIRFMRSFLMDGELDGVRILSAASVEMMAQNHIGDLEAASSITSSNHEVSNDFDFMPGSKDKFGLGFLINSEPIPGGRASGSLAWAGLYNSYYWIDKKNDICGVLITQILPFYDADVVALLTEFEQSVYAAAELSSQ